MEETEVINRRYYSLMVLGIILPFLLLPFLSYIFGSADQTFTYRLVSSRFLIWGVLGLMLLYAKQAEIQNFFLWEEESYGLSFYVVAIVGLFLLVLASGIIAQIPHWLGWRDNNTMMQKMQEAMRKYPLLLVFTVFTAGVTEEFIFRGYMISRLSLFLTNKYLPILISALLFMAIHLGYHNVSELIFTFLFGLIFGYHYQKYRNIKVLVVVHILVDLIATMPTVHHT